MLEDFKSYILHTFPLYNKKKQEESEGALTILFPRCTKRHHRNECLLNVIEICYMFEENNSIDKFPSLLSMTIMYQGI